jgi:hypothetical protein
MNGAWSNLNPGTDATVTFSTNQIVINPPFGSCTASDTIALTVIGLTLGSSPTPGVNVTVQTNQDPLPSNALQSGSLVIPQVFLSSFSSSSPLYVGQTGVAFSFQFTTSAVGALSGGDSITLNYPTGFFAGAGSLTVVVNSTAAAAVAYSGISQIVVILSSAAALGANAVVQGVVSNAVMGSPPTAGGLRPLARLRPSHSSSVRSSFSEGASPRFRTRRLWFSAELRWHGGQY